METFLRRAGESLVLSVTFLTLLAAPLAAQQADAVAASIRVTGASIEDVESAGIKPSDLAWLDLPEFPGAQIAYLLADETGTNPYTYRLRFPAGYELKPHVHRGRQYVTVLKGTLVLGFGATADRAKTVAFPAGSYVWLPKGIAHFAWTEGETVLQMHGIGRFAPEWDLNG